MELNLNDQIVPLLDERLDLALRIGHLPDSTLVARPLGTTRLVTCASPDYLASSPPIDIPAALRITPASSSPPRAGTGTTATATGTGRGDHPRLTCNQIRSASLACVQGLGITRLLHYQVADELADGRLVRVLREYEPKDLPIQLVYPHSLQLSPRVRAFVSGLVRGWSESCRCWKPVSRRSGLLKRLTAACSPSAFSDKADPAARYQYG